MIQLLREGIEDLRAMTPIQWALAIPALPAVSIASAWIGGDGFQPLDYPLFAACVLASTAYVLVVCKWDEFRDAFFEPPSHRQPLPEAVATTRPKKRSPRSTKTTPAITTLVYQPGTIEPEPETFHVDRSVEGIALPLTMQGLRFTQPGAAGPPEVADEVHLEYARNNRAILITKDRDFRDLHEAGAEHCGMVLAPHTMGFEEIAAFCAKLAKEMNK